MTVFLTIIGVVLIVAGVMIYSMRSAVDDARGGIGPREKVPVSQKRVGNRSALLGAVLLVMKISTQTIVAVSLVLTGCGGGSGSSDQPRNSNPPGGQSWTSTYGGSRSLANIDKESAPLLASVALIALEIPETYEGMWLPNPLGNGTGDVNETVPGPGGGSATVTGQIDQNYQGTIDVVFDSYRYDNTTLNGTYKQTYGPGDSGQMEFVDLEVTINGETRVYAGDTEIASGRQQITTNIVVSRLTDRYQFYLEGVVVDYSGTMVGSYEIGQREMSGTVYVTDIGRLDIEPDGPIVGLEFNERAQAIIATRGGGFLIRGGGPLLQFRALSRNFAALALDSDSDGEAEEGFRLTWRELFDIDGLAPEASNGPAANAGGTVYGTAGESTHLHGFYSHDKDNDWLTYEWQLTAKPPGSDLQLGVSSGPEISFTPDVSGDYVLGLRVTDGTNSSASSVSVLVDANQNRIGKSDPPTGSIEITSEAVAGAPITVDARSAANIPYLGLAPNWAAFGAGNVSVTQTANRYVAELTTDRPGPFIVGMAEDGGSRGVEEASRYVTLVVGLQDFEVQAWWELSQKGFAREIMPYDVNGDGRLDLATTIDGPGGQGLYLLTADDSGGFDVGPLVNTGNGRLDIGFLNGDQLPDIIVGDQDGIYIAYQLHDRIIGDFEFIPHPATQCDGTYARSAARIGDIDGDGRNDVIALRGCSLEILYWVQDSNGNLVGPSELQIPSLAKEMETADFNGDGRIDIVIGLVLSEIHSNLEDILVAYGQPNGTFVLGAPIPYQLEHGTRPIVGDLNTNGQPDILIFEQDGFVILEGRSDGTLEEIRSSTQILTYFYGNHKGGHGLVVDLDNDGDADIVACSGINQLNVSLLQADGSYLHVPIGDCRTHDTPNVVAVIDVNGDGKNDLLTGTEGFAPADSAPWYFLKAMYGGVSPYSRPVHQP